VSHYVTRLTLRDFGRYADATLDLAKVTVVAGPNLSGKTTLVRALEFALTGRAAGLAANESRAFVRDGRDRLRVEVTLSTGSEQPLEVARTLTTVTPKQGELDGLLPDRRQVIASLYAGQFAKMSVEARAQFLRSAVPYPAVEDVEAAVPVVERLFGRAKASQIQPEQFYKVLLREQGVAEAQSRIPVPPIVDREVTTSKGPQKASAMPPSAELRAKIIELESRPASAIPAQALLENVQKELRTSEEMLARLRVIRDRAKEQQPAEEAEYGGLCDQEASMKRCQTAAEMAMRVLRLRYEMKGAAATSCAVCGAKVDADDLDLIVQKSAGEEARLTAELTQVRAALVPVQERLAKLRASGEEYDKLCQAVTDLEAKTKELRETAQRAEGSAPAASVAAAKQLDAAITRGKIMFDARVEYEASVEANRQTAAVQERAAKDAAHLTSALNLANTLLRKSDDAAMAILRAALREASEALYFGDADALQLTDSLELKIIGRDARVAGRSAVERAGVAMAYAVAHLSPFGTLVIDDAEMFDRNTLKATVKFLAGQDVLKTCLVLVAESDPSRVRAPASSDVRVYWAERGTLTEMKS
jgi:hypothetical protein